MTTKRVLKALVEEAVRRGADSLVVEYKHGCEEVFASRGGVGMGIASFRSSSPEATRLRGALVRVARRHRHALIAGVRYEVRCTVYDSFGEDTYEVELRRG